jgi:hypothetical protein
MVASASLSATVEAAAIAASDSSSTSVAAAALNPLYREILELHNLYRSRHQVAPLMWSDTLAAEAAAYVSRCIWAHDPQSDAGENLYATGYLDDPSGALRSSMVGW